MTIISDNAGRSITLMRKSHNTGMNGDWKSPEVNMFDKKKIVSRLCLEWVCDMGMHDNYSVYHMSMTE